MLLMHLMHMTSSSLDTFAQMRQWTCFFAELRWLARLVGGLLPKRWLTCAFISGLWFGFQGSCAIERWSQRSLLLSLGKGWHSPMETRESISGNPWWINPLACIFSLRETCWSLPRMWVAQSGSYIYKALGNCSNKGLGW